MAILAILEPYALPSAIPGLPSTAASAETTISGAEVPNPTITMPIGMCKCCILHGPFSHLIQFKSGSGNPERTDPHHRSVGLTVRVGIPSKPGGNGHAAIKRVGTQPVLIFLTCRLRIIRTGFHQHPGKEQSHLRISGNQMQFGQQMTVGSGQMVHIHGSVQS